MHVFYYNNYLWEINILNMYFNLYRRSNTYGSVKYSALFYKILEENYMKTFSILALIKKQYA